MTSQPEQTVRPTFWRDLTGQTERWARTLVFAVVVGRLSLVALGIAILLAAGEGALDQFSGLTDVPTSEWVFIALVFAPLTESLAIRFVVWLLGSGSVWKLPVWATAMVCGALAVPLHGLSPVSLAVAPFFALMAAIQHHWMNRGRGWAGFWLIVAIHLVANAVAVCGMALIGPHDG
jgi:hypothetical protein